ncbi:MAG: flagellar biosynthesis anti-sigma factor FlgM [Burkholderiaceae bacterium]|jgi:flagellar biosynthesis anti-sigma factor FlgM|nr:flagellar biosynthesis anti-sigma factor FlgM [Burkholderiaceae bacterium]MBP7660467.1 flagellar biosynthesis anti-sigma factor FlgM [Burkholderiaceae bacterium]
MKVGNNIESKQPEPVPRATNGTRAPTAGSQEVAGTVPVDKVELSATSRSIAAADGAEQPVRPGKVEEVKAAIQEGRFHVSAEAVADKMISAAAELIETMATGRSQ